MVEARRTYSNDWSVPTSFGIWGGTTAERDRLALAIAHRIDPEPYWLNVEDPAQPREPGVDEVLKGVAEGRLFVLRPIDLAPHDDLGNMANWFVRDDVSPDDRIRTLADFMRLPDLARRLLADRSPMSSTGVLVIGNSNLVDPLKLYSVEEGGIRPLLEAINHFAVTIIFTITDAPKGNARDVDYLFRVDPVVPERKHPPFVTCSQGVPVGSAGLFSIGLQQDLGRLLGILRRG